MADYQETLQKSRADSAERSLDSYMKDPVKSRARSRESYTKDPEKIMLTLQYETTKFTRNTWRRVAKMKLAWLYPTLKSKKTAAVIGKGTMGARWATAPSTMY